MTKKLLSLLACLILMVSALNAQVTSKSTLDAGCPDPNYDTYPFLQCYQTATWNTSTCQWDVTGSPITNPATPQISATNVVTNVCGGRKVRYSVTLPTVASGTVVAEWSFVGSVLGANAVIDSGGVNAATIVVLYSSNLGAVQGDSVRVRFNYNNGCTYGSYALRRISLGSFNPPVSPVGSISQRLLLNGNGERVYRYTANVASNATGYSWTLPVSIGGVSGVEVDSGDISSSRVIRLRYASNVAPLVGDSIRVRAYNICFSGESRSFRLLPEAISTNLVTNVCGGRKVRYSVSGMTGNVGDVLPVISSGLTARPEWSFVGGELGSNAVIDSGTVNSSTILVSFTSNLAAAATDSILVKYVYSDGVTATTPVSRRIELGSFNPPVIPVGSISQRLLLNANGERIYRYTANGASNATGYSWTLPVTVGGVSGVVLDSGNISSSRVIRLRYASNVAPLVGDSIRVRAYNLCFSGESRSFRLLPEVISTDVVTNVCGGRKVRYSVSGITGNVGDVLPVISSGLTARPEWSFVGGVLGSNAVIDSGTVNSSAIVVLYTSNLGAVRSDSVRVRYVYSDGVTATSIVRRRIELGSFNPPVSPVRSIVQELVMNNCGARVYRYTANGASNATSYSWTLPVSVGGVSGVEVDSGDISSSRVIRVRYVSNNAAINGDSIRVRAYNLCYSGESRAFGLTNAAWTQLPLPQITTVDVVTNVCSGRKVRYSVEAPANSSGLVQPEWSFVGSVMGSNAVIDSGTVNSSAIVVLFTSNQASATDDSVRVRLNYNNGCAYSSLVRTSISLGAINLEPAVIGSVSQRLLLSTNGERVFRYTASESLNATGYSWTLPLSVGGVSGVEVDSGDISSSRVIRLRYASNVAPLIGDSIRVRAYNICFSGELRSFRLLPEVISTNVLTNVCGRRRVRYSLSSLVGDALPVSGTSQTALPEWSFVGGVLGSNAVIDSGTVNSSTIVVLFTSNLAADATDSVRVRYVYSDGVTVTLPVSCRIDLGSFNPPPAAVASISQQLVLNASGERVYRYTAWGAVHATRFEWTLPVSVGGVSGVTIDSGNIAFSKVIRVRYASTVSPFISDSIRVRSYNACFSAEQRAFRLAPEINAGIIVSNVCGGRRVRYSVLGFVGDSLPVSGSSQTARPEWSFVGGVLGSNAVIDSGTVNSPAIVVLYTSNLAAVSSDSIRVRYIYSDGVTVTPLASRRIDLGSFNPPPTAVASISQQLVLNASGERVYRYTAWGALHGTGFEWTLPVSVGGVSGATIDSGDIAFSKVIRVRYASTVSPFISDSIRVRSYNACFSAEQRAFRLAPEINAGIIVSNVCGGRRVRYSVLGFVGDALPVSGSSHTARPEWSFVGGVLGSNAVIDSGTVNSPAIVVLYTSNLAAVSSDSIRVKYIYSDGVTITPLASRRIDLGSFNPPPTAVASISQQLVSNTCGERVYRYTAWGALHGTGFEWILPATLGGMPSGATIDSGDIAFSKVIRVRYSSNNGAINGDSIRVRSYNGCFSAEPRAFRLTNAALQGCTTPQIPARRANPELITFGARVYPNPSAGAFNVRLTGAGSEEVELRVLDVQGRMLKVLRSAPQGIITLGSELKSGVYLLEVRQGKNRQTTRILKQ